MKNNSLIRVFFYVVKWLPDLWMKFITNHKIRNIQQNTFIYLLFPQREVKKYEGLAPATSFTTEAGIAKLYDGKALWSASRSDESHGSYNAAKRLRITGCPAFIIRGIILLRYLSPSRRGTLTSSVPYPRPLGANAEEQRREASISSRVVRLFFLRKHGFQGCLTEGWELTFKRWACLATERNFLYLRRQFRSIINLKRSVILISKENRNAGNGIFPLLIWKLRFRV